MKKLLVILLFLSSSVYAKKFTSQFTEFELPRGWSCMLEGSEWVCQSDNKQRKKEAIIILAAKERGPQDTLAEYQSYLQRSKTFRLPGGRSQISEPKSTDKKKVNGHTWIDSLHLASEVPGFYTRYLATVKGDLGVAVTFSVAKDHYSSYKAIFDKIIETLKVFAVKQKVNYVAPKGGGSGGGLPGDEGEWGDETSGPGIGVGQRKRKKGSGGLGDNMLFIIIGVIAIGAFLAMKKKGGAKGGGKKKKKKKKKKKE